MTKILVVDDDVWVLRRFSRLLAAETAESPEEGLRMAREMRPDVVLLDVIFPGRGNGIEAIPDFLSLGCEVVVITNDYYREDEMLSLRLGAYAYAEKGDNQTVERVVLAALAEIHRRRPPRHPRPYAGPR